MSLFGPRYASLLPLTLRSKLFQELVYSAREYPWTIPGAVVVDSTAVWHGSDDLCMSCLFVATAAALRRGDIAIAFLSLSLYIYIYIYCALNFLCDGEDRM